MSDQKSERLEQEELRVHIEILLEMTVSTAKYIFPFTAHMASIALLEVKEEKKHIISDAPNKPLQKSEK